MATGGEVEEAVSDEVVTPSDVRACIRRMFPDGWPKPDVAVELTEDGQLRVTVTPAVVVIRVNESEVDDERSR